MTARTSPEVEQQVLNLWATTSDGSRVIGRAVGLSGSGVLRILDRNGVIVDGTPRRKRRTTRDQDAEIIRRYIAGESGDALAAEFGFKTHVSIHQRVRAAGHEVRPPGNTEQPITEDEGREILRLRNEEGLSQERIARKMSTVGQSRISAFLRQNGHRTWSLTRHPRFAGGPVKMSNGYFAIRVDENDPLAAMASKNGYIFEHRYVMAQSLGRPLTKKETVHHINGDRDDNRLENLQLRNGAHGKGIVLACQDCGSRNVVPVFI